jgi:hypothetical protein
MIRKLVGHARIYRQRRWQSLFLHALEFARQQAYKTLQLEADPNAVGFYEKMGMYKICEHQSEVNGQPRALPIMEMHL